MRAALYGRIGSAAGAQAPQVGVWAHDARHGRPAAGGSIAARMSVRKHFLCGNNGLCCSRRFFGHPRSTLRDRHLNKMLSSRDHNIFMCRVLDSKLAPHQLCRSISTQIDFVDFYFDTQFYCFDTQFVCCDVHLIALVSFLQSAVLLIVLNTQIFLHMLTIQELTRSLGFQTSYVFAVSDLVRK